MTCLIEDYRCGQLAAGISTGIVFDRSGAWPCFDPEEN